MTKSTHIHGKASFDKKYYQRFFSKYDRGEFKMYRNWAEGWIRFLENYLPFKDGRGKKVLEIGSSVGYFSRTFKSRGFDVVASDISLYIVNKAKKVHKDIDFQVVDVEKKITVRGNFDFVVAFAVFEHLKNPEQALKNIYRKLKKGGKLVFSTPFPTKRSLSDPTHINVQKETWWLEKGKKIGFRRRKLIHATFVPFLYRINKVFSWGFPIKTNLPLVNSTAFFVFEK